MSPSGGEYGGSSTGLRGLAREVVAIVRARARARTPTHRRLSVCLPMCLPRVFVMKGDEAAALQSSCGLTSTTPSLAFFTFFEQAGSRGNQQPPDSLSGLPLGEAGATRRHRQQLEQRDTLAASLPARAWHPQCCPRAAAPAACRCSRYGAWPRQHTDPPAVPADLTDAPARRPLARPPQDIFDVVEIDPTGKKFDKGACAPRNAWIGRRV